MENFQWCQHVNTAHRLKCFSVATFWQQNLLVNLLLTWFCNEKTCHVCFVVRLRTIETEQGLSSTDVFGCAEEFLGLVVSFCRFHAERSIWAGEASISCCLRWAHCWELVRGGDLFGWKGHVTNGHGEDVIAKVFPVHFKNLLLEAGIETLGERFRFCEINVVTSHNILRVFCWPVVFFTWNKRFLLKTWRNSKIKLSLRPKEIQWVFTRSSLDLKILETVALFHRVIKFVNTRKCSEDQRVEINLRPLVFDSRKT